MLSVGDLVWMKTSSHGFLLFMIKSSQYDKSDILRIMLSSATIECVKETLSLKIINILDKIKVLGKSEELIENRNIKIKPITNLLGVFDIINKDNKYLKTEQDSIYCQVIYKFDKELYNEDFSYNLRNLNIGSLTSLLGYRYLLDRPYTLLNSIMISINPLKKCAEKKNDEYFYNPYNYIRKVFGNIISTKQSQSIIVSGISGSGKTEIAKSLMYSVISETKSTNIIDKETMDETNILFESFANATTTQNSNSSRIARIINFSFDIIQNKIIMQYYKNIAILLERSRIVHRSENELNFHVFYYFLHGKIYLQ